MQASGMVATDPLSLTYADEHPRPIRPATRSLYNLELVFTSMQVAIYRPGWLQDVQATKGLIIIIVRTGSYIHLIQWCPMLSSPLPSVEEYYGTWDCTVGIR